MRFSILLKELRGASTTETFWGPFSFVAVTPSRPVDLVTVHFSMGGTVLMIVLAQ